MYLYSYPSTHGISGLAAGGAWKQLEVCVKMTIQWTQRCTRRPWLSECGDVIGGSNWAILWMHLEGHDWVILQDVIEQVWRYPWRPWLSEFWKELWGHDRASFEMYLEATIMRTWRLKSSHKWYMHWNSNWENLEMHLEGMIKQDLRRTWRWLMWGALGADETLCIS